MIELIISNNRTDCLRDIIDSAVSFSILDDEGIPETDTRIVTLKKMKTDYFRGFITIDTSFAPGTVHDLDLIHRLAFIFDTYNQVTPRTNHNLQTYIKIAGLKFAKEHGCDNFKCTYEFEAFGEENDTICLRKLIERSRDISRIIRGLGHDYIGTDYENDKFW